jgi:hypothetical protein
MSEIGKLEADAAPAARLRAFAGAGERPLWAAVGVIALVSLLQRGNGATADVSWLMSMCERILDGERGWIDIFETTPPVPTLIYMPAIVFARAAGVSAEFAVFALTYACVLPALAFAARLLPDRASRWPVILSAAIVFLILSSDAFAQREYFAALFTLPMFAIFVARAEGSGWPTLSARVAAALLGGLAFAIKPPLFAAPFLAMAAFELHRTRSLAFLLPSMLPVAAVAGVALTAVSLAAFPAYLGGVTTLMRDIYVPLHLSPVHALHAAFSGTLLAFGAAAVFVRGRAATPAVTLALTLAGAFTAVYFAQGKFFPYHLLPASLFAMIAVGAALRAGARAFGRAIAPAIAFAAAILMLQGYGGRARLSDHDWANDLDRPTAMAISPMISTSFPIAERIDARWIDRIHGQWVLLYARIALSRDGLSDAERTRYQRYFDAELARTTALIREKKPELIFTDEAGRYDWLTEAMLAADPGLLDDYEVFARENRVVVLRRRGAEQRG